MAARVVAKAVTDDYFMLVREFPLVRFRDDKHLEQAQAMIDRLLTVDLAEGSQMYLDVLTDLVEAYEDEHVPMPDASEGAVLAELIRSSGLTQTALAKRVEISQSTISAVLKGTRSLTKEQIVALARYFHVSPAAFLPR